MDVDCDDILVVASKQVIQNIMRQLVIVDGGHVVGFFVAA